MHKIETESKVREFHSGITPEFLALFFLDILCAVLIAAMGIDMNRTWPGRGTLFIVIGVGVVLGAGFLMKRISGKSIKMTSKIFLYREGKREIVIPWENFRTFVPHRAGKKWFRSSILGDYETRFSIDSFSFPEYELIVNIIAVARKKAQGKGYEIGG